MKLKSVEIYKSDDVPDHILQDVHNAAIEIGEAIFDICMKYPSNITLGALNWTHAAMTNHLVVDTDEAIENAGLQQAKALYNNIKHCRAVRKEEQEGKKDAD